MGFTIPNYTQAVANQAGDQAEPDSVDFQILGNASSALIYDSNYPSNGEVTAVNGTTVRVAAYHAISGGSHLIKETTTDLAVAASDADSRFDLVVIRTSGPAVIKGTASGVNPVFPALTAGDVVLASIYISGGGGQVSTQKIVDKRKFISSNTTRYEATAPGASSGVSGDLWINTSANAVGQSEVYYKTGGQWENLAMYVPMTSTNTANNLILRDGSGGFSAGAITGTSLALGSGSITAGAVSATSLVLNGGAITNAGAIGATSVTVSGLTQSATISATGTISTQSNITANGSISASGTISGSNMGTWTPVQQGGGTGQGTNKIYIGWASPNLRVQVDGSNFGATWPISVSGSAATLNGFAQSTSDTPSTIVLRDSLGQITTRTRVLVNGTNGGDALTLGAGDGSNGTLPLVGGSVYFEFGIANIVTTGTVRPVTTNTYDLGSTSFRWRTIYAQNALNTSDKNLKKNVTSSSIGLNLILKLTPVQFEWKDGDTKTHLGLVSQDVKKVLDSLGMENFGGWDGGDVNDPASTQSLAYAEFIPPLIKAIQELAARVEALEAGK